MKFLHLLDIAKNDVVADKERIRKKALRSDKNSAIRILSGVTAAVLVLGLISGGIYFGIMNMPTASASDIPAELEKISPISAVRATSFDGSNITADTEFKVTTYESMSSEKFRSVFEISPYTEYNLKKNSGNSFTVSFDNGLAANTLYTLSSKSDGKTVYSWAFQTDNTFGISSRLPDSTYIDSNGTISIEFTHSNVENFEECFTIYPAIPGTFEHYGRRWVFIPSSEFEFDTLYTVTISKNVTGGNNETLDSDYSFSFSASDPDSWIYVSYTSQGYDDCFLPDQTPAACIEYWNKEISKADVTVYRIPTSEDYIEIHKKYLGYNFVSSVISEKLNSCVKYIDFTADLMNGNDDSNSRKAFLQYPQKFDTGYYVSEIRLDDITLYHIFQINELAVYSVTSNGDYTVWVNSTTAKSAVSGATVEIEGFDAKTTDEKGLAVFNGGNIDIYQNVILKVTDGIAPPYITSISPTSTDELNDASINYYSYLYTDSELYRPGDSINVWGFVIPRTDKAKVPDSLKLYCLWSEEYIDIDVSKAGTFTAQVELSSACPDEYSSIAVYDGDSHIVGSSFYITDYTLPTYTLEISTDKNAYFNGEEINYTVNALFFDGTPASNVSIYASFGDNYYEIETDETGKAECVEIADYNYIPEYPDNNEAHIFSGCFEVIEPDGASVYYQHAVAVFDSDITAKVIKDGSSVDIELYAVNLDMLNTKSISGNGSDIYLETSDTDSYAIDPYDTELEIELYKVTYEKEISGSSYNPITMQVENSYTYNRVDQIVSYGSLKTENGKTSLALPDKSSNDECYYYMIHADGINRSELCIQYYDYSYDYGDTFSYALSSDKTEYGINDNILLKLTETDTHSQVSEGTLLLSGINADIINNDIYEAAESISMHYDKMFSPSVCIAGAYFDGNNVYLVQKLWLETERRELEILLTPDKNKYEPGEDVSIEIDVTDADGNPVQAEVNISIIDSALKEMFTQTLDIYDSVYFPRLYLSDIKRTVSTYLPSAVNDYGFGKGGGGGEYIRKNFELSPYFKTVSTDRSGKSKVVFTLPDSITSWSVTAQALTSDAQVGQKQINIIATKEFYITSSVGQKIKTTDDAVFPIKFISEDGSSQCQYTVELIKDDAVIITESGLSDINTVMTKNFGKLGKGSYTLRITSKYGQLRDVLSLDFAVEDSYNSEFFTKHISIEENTLIDVGFNSDVTVNIYDEEYDFYFTVIDSLLSGQEDRIEQLIGSSVAKAYVSGLKYGQMLPDDFTKLSKYQNTEGLQLFGDSEYITADASAKITAVAGKYFDTDIQTLYYQNVLQQMPTVCESLYAYWALASLGEPVLNDLEIFRNNIDSLSEEETLCLALAYAYAGDYITARDIYDNYISGKIKNANGIAEYQSQTAFDTENLTGLAAILAVKISAPESKPLIKYILGCNNLTSARGLILTAFLNSYIPYLEGENTVKIIHADGSTDKITYSKTGYASLKIPYSDIGKTSFSSVKGTSIMTVGGNVTIDTISSQYTDISADVVLYAETEENPDADSMTYITVNAELPEGYSEDVAVYVNLPYCMKIISPQITTGTYEFSYDSTQLKLYFSEGILEATIECYVPSAGEFTIEPIILIDKTNSSFAETEAKIITVT